MSSNIDKIKITQKDILLNFLNSNSSYINLTANIYKDIDKIDEINIKVPFKKEDILFSKNYSLKEKIPFDSGDLLVKGLSISPTRITLEIESIGKDDNYLEGFDRIYLRNDKGNVYTCIGNAADKDNHNIKQYYFVPSIYFDDLPSNLYLCYEGIRVGTKSEKTIKLNLNDNYPKNINYMGENIIFEDIKYLNNDVLQVTMDFPSNEKLKVGSIMLLSGENKIISNGSSAFVKESEGRIKRIEYFDNVPSLNEYEIELSEFGYFIPLSGETKLILSE